MVGERTVPLSRRQHGYNHLQGPLKWYYLLNVMHSHLKEDVGAVNGTLRKQSSVVANGFRQF